MPPEPILDISKVDTDTVAVTREEFYQVNPHRYEFQQLDGIYFVDRETEIMAGFRDVRDDVFWVRGHIPAAESPAHRDSTPPGRCCGI